MIVDKIENIELYKNLSPQLSDAFMYLKETDFNELALGKHTVEGDAIFTIINEYNTKVVNENTQLEAHRKYIDIQLVLSGKEELGFTSRDNQIPTKSYDSESDYELYRESFDTVLLKKGLFCVLFPDDLHAPGLIHKDAELIKKVVIKVKL